jgi:hypothetical protein
VVVCYRVTTPDHDPQRVFERATVGERLRCSFELPNGDRAEELADPATVEVTSVTAGPYLERMYVDFVVPETERRYAMNRSCDDGSVIVDELDTVGTGTTPLRVTEAESEYRAQSSHC